MDLGEKFIIRSNSLEPKQGNILISEPLMNDFHFGRSVILLIDHVESEGSFGVILNKKTNVFVNQLVENFQDFDGEVYIGGPVSDQRLFFLHTLGELIPDSYPILNGLYWGGDGETLETLIKTGIANKDNTRFYLGYAGWESGQLVSELVRNSWAISDIDVSQYLNMPTETMWDDCVKKLGKRYAFWKHMPMNFEEN